ncbi:hypothetical protein ACFPZI_36870 [Streptomyces chlorus]|uniref:Uncharacterized protein n=1 Tax=Streptomyces chlorus TaxID=887452 RepID=A0ABW1E8H7_9ACTN
MFIDNSSRWARDRWQPVNSGGLILLPRSKKQLNENSHPAG